jgi:hypothetical protein
MKRSSRLAGVGRCSCPKMRLKHGDDPDSMFDPKQLAIGQKIEMEHTSDPSIAKKIAKAHLAEFKDYYIYLPRLEKAMKTNFVARNVNQKLTPNFPWSLKIY